MRNLIENYSLLFDIKQVFHLILKTLISELNADSASLMFVEEDYLTIVEQIGLSMNSQSNIRFKIGTGIAGTAAIEKKPIIMNDAFTDKRFKEFNFQQENIISNISYPILINDEVIAVLNISSATPNQFSENKIFFIKNYVSLIKQSLNTLLNNEKNLYLNFLDDITNLYNFSYFYEALERETSRSLRYNDVFSVIFIKINNFKDIVYKYKDENVKFALKKLADLIKKTSRRVDICAIYKQDIFVVLTPETGRGGAEKKRDRFIEAVNNKKHYLGLEDISLLPEFQIKTSIASFPDDAKNVDELLKFCNF